MKAETKEQKHAATSIAKFPPTDKACLSDSPGKSAEGIFIPPEIAIHRRDLERAVRAAMRTFKSNPFSCLQLSLGHGVVHYHEPSRSEFLYGASDEPMETPVRIEISEQFIDVLAANPQASYKSDENSIVCVMPNKAYWAKRASELAQTHWVRVLLPLLTDQQDLDNLSDLYLGKIHCGRMQEIDARWVAELDNRYDDPHGKIAHIDHIKRQLLGGYPFDYDSSCVGLHEYILVANFNDLLPGLTWQLRTPSPLKAVAGHHGD